MSTVGRHAVLSAIALVLGAALVAWVRPETTPGAIFLVAVVVAVINAIGGVVWRAPKIAWIGLAPLLIGQSGCPGATFQTATSSTASGTVTATGGASTGGGKRHGGGR
jgi:hypothetical protein